FCNGNQWSVCKGNAAMMRPGRNMRPPISRFVHGEDTMRKNWLAATLVAACAATAALPAAAQNTLKMAYALSTSSHYGAGAEAFAKSIEGTTNGKFKVQQFPNSALGGEREVIEGLQIGTIDLAIVSTGARSEEHTSELQSRE